VDVVPRKATRDQLAGAARAALGAGRRLESVRRLAGGSRKGVYRLTMDDATTVIAYLWEDSENYWPATERDGDLADPFSPGVGLDLFEAAHARLDSLGLRVPAIYLVDRDRTRYPADLAIVEDFPGETLMDLFARDPRAAEPTMARLGEALEAMRRHRAPSYGKVAPGSTAAEHRTRRRARRPRSTSRCAVARPENRSHPRPAGRAAARVRRSGTSARRVRGRSQRTVGPRVVSAV
jgi:hypothetical protein